MTRAEAAAILASADPWRLRVNAGIGLKTVAVALGTDPSAVWRWETLRNTPTGPRGFAYTRFIAGLIRHEAVTWDRAGGFWLGIQEQAA